MDLHIWKNIILNRLSKTEFKNLIIPKKKSGLNITFSKSDDTSKENKYYESNSADESNEGIVW